MEDKMVEFPLSARRKALRYQGLHQAQTLRVYRQSSRKRARRKALPRQGRLTV